MTLFPLILDRQVQWSATIIFWKKCVPLSLLILPKQIQVIDDGEYIHTPMVMTSVPFQTPLQPNTTRRFSEFHDKPCALYSSKTKKKQENSIHRRQIKVSRPDTVSHLKWTRKFEWCVIRWGSKNGHQKACDWKRWDDYVPEIVNHSRLKSRDDCGGPIWSF